MSLNEPLPRELIVEPKVVKVAALRHAKEHQRPFDEFGAARRGHAIDRNGLPTYRDVHHSVVCKRAVTILLVVGDLATRTSHASRLVRDGYTVVAESSVELALARLPGLRPDVVVLGVGLDGGGPLAAFGRVRACCPTPVVLADAVGDAADRAFALDAGVDDVVPRPVTPEELASRVGAVLRRRAVPHGAGPPPDDLEHAGPVTFDLRARRAWCRGEPVELTALEFRLLSHFVAHAGEALTREQLLNDVWGHTYSDGSTVTVHVRRLRAKIELDPAVPAILCTVFGVGYRYEGGCPPGALFPNR